MSDIIPFAFLAFFLTNTLLSCIIRIEKCFFCIFEVKMEQAISSDLIRGHIDTIILHTLLDGDKYAQQIIDTVDVKSDKQYQLNQATLYSSLKRLENLGYVKTYWFDAKDGRRKFIKITPKGKDFVDANLTNWSFSRAIIDKLMNVAPERVIPIVTAPISEETKSSANTENMVLVTTEEKARLDALTQNNEQQNVAYTPVTNSVNQDINDVKKEDVKEINFRNILNGLIKSTAPQQHFENSEKTVIEQVGIEEVSSSKKSFSDTLDMEFKEVNARSGKIDFSDLVLSAENEGYKIRVSSRYSARPQGFLYQNRLQFFSILMVVAISVLEFLLLFFKFNNCFSQPFYIVSAVILGLVFATFFIKFVANPLKTLNGRISGDRMLTCAIVLFNFILITFALNLWLNVNLSDKTSVIRYLLVPMLVFADVFCYFVFEFIFSTLKYFKVKNKQ